jgi:hypothetical protein
MAASGGELNGNSLSELGGRTLIQLRELAKRIGLGGYSRLTKDGLIEAMSQSEASRTAVITAPEKLESSPSAAAATPELPSHITFLPRDPQWAYVFWEISSSDQERANAAGATQLALRVADVTGLPLGAAITASNSATAPRQAAGSPWPPPRWRGCQRWSLHPWWPMPLCLSAWMHP